jgi:hypothetical protein
MNGTRDARFFLVHDTKTGNIVPNKHKMYQMVIKIPNVCVDGALSSSGPKMILNWTTPKLNLFIMLENL